ncbi:MAG: undecaprenyl-diphosphate phosphatase [Oscillospiraceae bacterium]|nr:undecaprenyl-diphosphate phosphatase [Oscillospiraceae bacterium]MBQ3986924.1 undecaprenyl-diphosphate phosphatase [Oscillospiraceae bacterium]
MNVSVFVAIFLGIVQGLTEFLPVSSSGHLSIFQSIFGLDFNSEEHLLFDVLLHLATLVSIYFVYKAELKTMVKDTFEFLSGRSSNSEREGRVKPSVRMTLLILVATLPLFILLPFHSQIQRLYTNLGFIAFSLIMTGAILLISTVFFDGRKSEKTATIADAFIVGLGQAIATIPGISRSGTTITVGLSRGFKRKFAITFSFLMSIPAVLGSTFVTLISAIKAGIQWSNVPAYLIGMAVAGVVGYLALSFMKRFMATRPFTYFAFYCFGAGFITVIIAIIK